MKVEDRAVGIDNHQILHNIFIIFILWLIASIINVIFLSFLMSMQTDYFLDVDVNGFINFHWYYYQEKNSSIRIRKIY